MLRLLGLYFRALVYCVGSSLLRQQEVDDVQSGRMSASRWRLGNMQAEPLALGGHAPVR